MAKAPSVDLLSPIGRIVYGDCFVANTTDANGNPLTYAAGHPKFGQPKQEYLLNLAVDKRDPEFGPYYAAIDKLARESWPQFFNGPVGADGRPTCTNPNMSLKIMDGDGFDGNGKPNNVKEGYAGCWIIKYKSAFAPKVFYKDRYADNDQIKDSNLVHAGDFVRVFGSMSSNQNVQKPGLYMNLSQIALWGKGTKITTGPSAATAFGGAPAAAGFVPAGMQALPALAAPMPGLATMQPAGMPMASPAGATPMGMPPGGPLAAMPMAQPAQTLPPAMTGFAPPAAMPGAAAMPAQMPTYVAPNPGILAGPGMPALPPLQPAAPQLTAAGVASGYTYDQYRQAGHTDDTLRAHGLIV